MLRLLDFFLSKVERDLVLTVCREMLLGLNCEMQWNGRSEGR